MAEGESERNNLGLYSRGYLPHIDTPFHTQAITFRLNDSLPAHVLRELERELESISEPERSPHAIRQLNSRLDAGMGSCILRERRALGIVETALVHGHEERYELLAWVVMPNHVHTLIRTFPNWPLPHVVASWKKWTARRLNELSGQSGKVWFREYFDRYARDPDHRENIIRYIERNPVKAGICEDPVQFIGSSARFRTPEGSLDWDLIAATIGRPSR